MTGESMAAPQVCVASAPGPRSPRQAHLAGQAQAAHQADVLPGQVNLAAEAMACRMGKGVVVVVPALAEGERGHPGIVFGVVTAVMAGRAPAVGG